MNFYFDAILNDEIEIDSTFYGPFNFIESCDMPQNTVTLQICADCTCMAKTLRNQ